MKFGLCVIGCGAFAQTFAREMRSELADIDLYFASRDAERAANFATLLGGKDSFGSYESAAADPRVDAVYICTPHHLHLPHARLAADAGKHILLEKPLARTEAEAQSIIAVAAAGGVTLMVAENCRFMPPVRAVKEMADDGRLGEPRLFQLHEQFPFNLTGWRSDAELNGGGAFIDGGIHKASIMAYLAGSPSEIYAAAVPPQSDNQKEAEDGVVVMLRYAPHSPSLKTGMVGIINHSWSAGPHTPRPWASLAGSAASAVFDLGNCWIDTIDPSGRQRQWLNHGNDPWGIAAMVREFRQSIQEARPPTMTGEEGARDVALVQAAYASIRKAAPVPFPLPG